MSNISAKFIRSYRSKKGNTTFVYGISGSKEQLAAYAKSQGEFHTVDETTGTPLWFTTRFVGKNANLIITTNNKCIADMSAFDQADSLAKQYGGNLGEQLAKTAAQQLLGATPTPAPAASVPAPAPEESAPEESVPEESVSTFEESAPAPEESESAE